MQSPPLHPCSVAFYARVPASSPVFAKHSQRTPSVQPAATLLQQLHNPPPTLQKFSWSGEDVFKRLDQRRATQLLGLPLIVSDNCPEYDVNCLSWA